MSEARPAATEARPIVVGDDGRAGGEDALALAHLLAEPARAEVIVISAEDDSASETLISHSVGAGAGTIVIGSSHRRGLGRVLPGAVGNRLLRTSPCRLAIAPAGFAGAFVRGFNLIGVAYDGSAESRAALEEGVSLARSFDAALRLISVIEDAEFAGKGWAGVAPVTALDEADREDVRKRVELNLASAMEAIPAPIHVTTETLRGRPAAEVADATGRLDLLVLGTRGYGPLRRVLVGGVSGPVSRSARCPLVVAPRFATAMGQVPAEPGSARHAPPLKALDDVG